MQLLQHVSYHCDEPLYALLGAPGYWHPECFEVVSRESEPFDYAYSGKLVEQFFKNHR